MLIFPVVLSTLINDAVLLKFFLKELIGTSASPNGTENRVPATTYSVFSVVNGDEWLPALLGICKISAVLNVVRSILAILGVLLAFAKSHLPSCLPLVCDNSRWCWSSHATGPLAVFSIDFVSSRGPGPGAGGAGGAGGGGGGRPGGGPD